MLLNTIGQILAEDRDYPLENTLLHAEVDFNMVRSSIFKDLAITSFVAPRTSR